MKKLLVYIRDFRLECVLAPLFKLLEASFELIVPLIMAAIIDRGIPSGDTGFIVRMCLWLVARMQHRATRRLEKLNRSLETVIENIPGGFFRYDRDAGQAFDYVSEGFLRLLGHTRESFAAACGNRFDRMVHPDDRERVLASVREQTTRGDDATVEYRVFTADGRVLWLYDRGHLVREPSGRSRLYVIVMDITPLRQTRQALKISEERYRILTELSERIIFEHDLRGREGFLSPRFRDKFGYEPERDPATGALSETCVYGVHNGDFLITDHIRIVCHSVRNDILSFKQIHFVIIYAYINNVLCNFHCNTLHISCSFRTAHVHLSFVIHRLCNINRISLISDVHD